MKLLFVLFSVLYVSHDALGQENVVVTAHVGDQSVSLTVIMKQNLDSLSDPSVLWIRGKSEIVHLRVKQGDHLDRQSSVFKNRTRMNPDSFQTGNLTLVLSKPTISDTGVYNCVVRDGSTEKESTIVALFVTDPPPPDHTWLFILLTVGGVVVVVLLLLVILAVCRQKQTEESPQDAFVGVICCKPRPEPTPVL